MGADKQPLEVGPEAKPEINSYYLAQHFRFLGATIEIEIILCSFRQFNPIRRNLKFHFYASTPQPLSKSKSQMLKSKFSIS